MDEFKRPDHPLLVCGLSRCGSSLMMQILQELGIPWTHGSRVVSGEIEGVPPYTDELWEQSKGKAIKVLDPHTHPLPEKFDVIVMLRDHTQQAKSIVKWGKTFFPETVQDDPKVVRSIRDGLMVAEEGMRNAISRGRGFLVKFEDVINNPFDILANAVDFLNYWGWLSEKDIDLLSLIDRTIKKRNGEGRASDCLPHLLEEQLVVEAEQKRRRENS